MRTAMSGIQIRAGLRGVVPGIEDMMATIKKYRFASLRYWVKTASE